MRKSCIECGKAFEARSNARICSDECRGSRRRAQVALALRRHYAKNSEAILETARIKYAENPAPRLQRQRDGYAKDPTKKLEYSAKYYRDHKERKLAQNKAWAEANREHMSQLLRAYQARKLSAPSAPITAETLSARMDYFGRKCWVCGGSANSMDHVKPVNKGGSHMLSNLRPACGPCNSSKSDKWPYDPSARREFLQCA